MRETTKNMTLAAMFLAIGLVLPLLTGQIPQIGNMLLPMHIPVFLCAIWGYCGPCPAIDYVCHFWDAGVISHRNCYVL